MAKKPTRFCDIKTGQRYALHPMLHNTWIKVDRAIKRGATYYNCVHEFLPRQRGRGYSISLAYMPSDKLIYIEE
jgi:hypothetical protein